MWCVDTVPVGAVATVLLGAASAVHFRTVLREGQVCQSVQGRLYLWAQQWAVQCGFVWCSVRWCVSGHGVSIGFSHDNWCGRGACRLRGKGAFGCSEGCAFPYCDVRRAGLPVGPGATVPLGAAVGCAVWIRFGAVHDVVYGHGVPVGAVATVLLGAASAVHFRTVMREGQVCQSVQVRLYL